MKKILLLILTTLIGLVGLTNCGGKPREKTKADKCRDAMNEKKHIDTQQHKGGFDFSQQASLYNRETKALNDIQIYCHDNPNGYNGK